MRVLPLTVEQWLEHTRSTQNAWFAPLHEIAALVRSCHTTASQKVRVDQLPSYDRPVLLTERRSPKAERLKTYRLNRCEWIVNRLPPLKSLQAFDAAARHLSFKKAAEELHVTPTAISHQVKLLEERIQRKLFNRLVRSLSLTKAGETYAPLVERVFLILNWLQRKSATPPRRASCQ
ncbi:LysR family transcriptional regulator [Mesorhizobium sp. M0244]|uniref:LysR family transcriptional regulator n=1 Tax=Mesorhizobium sp. M0244 TaxID=2956926 RepID=UPI00333CEA95